MLITLSLLLQYQAPFVISATHHTHPQRAQISTSSNPTTPILYSLTFLLDDAENGAYTKKSPLLPMQLASVGVSYQGIQSCVKLTGERTDAGRSCAVGPSK